MLVGRTSNSVCLKEELLKGAECSFCCLCGSLYCPGPGMDFVLSNTLFFCVFPKTKAIYWNYNNWLYKVYWWVEIIMKQGWSVLLRTTGLTSARSPWNSEGLRRFRTAGPAVVAPSLVLLAWKYPNRSKEPLWPGTWSPVPASSPKQAGDSD